MFLRQIPIPIPADEIQNQVASMIDDLLIVIDADETDEQKAPQAEIDRTVKALYFA